MRVTVVVRILGLLLMLFSITVVPSIVLALVYGEPTVNAFLDAGIIILGIGFLLWWPVRRENRELRVRDGFVVVVLFWTVLGSAGGVPLFIADRPAIDFVDAMFESISGLTTTGATVIIGLDDLPKSILFYRQQLQWLGGMGIIVLAVAILPMLGVGGMQLYRAETPGPLKDTKLTPRITETAKALWYFYVAITVLCGLAYWIAGMDAFDACAHAFATIAIGGFSTHDASIGYFDSALIEAVAVLFMLIAGANFGLHFLALRRLDVRLYWLDSEFRAYLVIVLGVALLVGGYLYLSDLYPTGFAAIHHGVFQAVSIGTTTGFTTAEYHTWPGFLPVLLLFASFVGGCAGSTGGGIKVIRILLLYKQGIRELRRLVHPRSTMVVKINGKGLPDRVIDAVWGFFSAYVAVFVLMLLALMATGLDQITAFSAVAASMNNLGPGLGEVGSHYAGLNDPAKLILCLAMLLGRLEIFTLLVLFMPAFWQK